VREASLREARLYREKGSNERESPRALTGATAEHPDAARDERPVQLGISAHRYLRKTAIFYYGTGISYVRLHDEVKSLAGYLHEDLGVEGGDRVVLYMQNSPQFMVAYYAILRANAAET